MADQKGERDFVFDITLNNYVLSFERPITKRGCYFIRLVIIYLN